MFARLSCCRPPSTQRSVMLQTSSLSKRCSHRSRQGLVRSSTRGEQHLHYSHLVTSVTALSDQLCWVASLTTETPGAVLFCRCYEIRLLRIGGVTPVLRRMSKLGGFCIRWWLCSYWYFGLHCSCDARQCEQLCETVSGCHSRR